MRCEREDREGGEEEAWVARGCDAGGRFVVRKKEAKVKIVWRMSQLRLWSWRRNLHCVDVSMCMCIKNGIDHSIN